MAVYMVGDVHGQFWRFKELKQKLQPDDVVIQVGDFGIYPGWQNKWPGPLPCPIYFIDGNHENFNMLPNLRKPGEIVEMAENLFYVPRGTILEIKGKRIGFCGGGESIDKSMRKENISWFKEERISEEDIAPLLGQKLDLLVVHTPPTNFIAVNFKDRTILDWFGIPKDWVDQSAAMIQKLVDSVDCPVIAGHFHQSVFDEKVRILHIDEVYRMRSWEENEVLL